MRGDYTMLRQYKYTIKLVVIPIVVLCTMFLALSATMNIGRGVVKGAESERVYLAPDEREVYSEQILDFIQYENTDKLSWHGTYAGKNATQVHISDGYTTHIYVFNEDDILTHHGTTRSSDLLPVTP